MQFTEQETGAIVGALSFQAASLERLEESYTLRQRYAGQSPEGRARCAKKVDEYRAKREELLLLIGRLEYVGGAS